MNLTTALIVSALAAAPPATQKPSMTPGAVK